MGSKCVALKSLQILDKNENKLEMFWYLENGIVKSSKDVPPQFQQPGNPSPQLDCSVGGLYYKIYAEGVFKFFSARSPWSFKFRKNLLGHERNMASQVVIKPAFIGHRRLYLAEEGRNYPDPQQFMLAAKEAYLEKMVNQNEELSFQSFCSQCFRCFNSPFDLQVHKQLVHQVTVHKTVRSKISKKLLEKHVIRNF